MKTRKGKEVFKKEKDIKIAEKATLVFLSMDILKCIYCMKENAEYSNR